MTSIGGDAFASSGLTNIKIPAGVGSIGGGAFANTYLTSIEIPDGINRLGDFLFSGCSNLTDVAIPESITIIGSQAFQSCAALTTVTIPAGVTSIASYAFSNCSGLYEIVLEGNAPSLGSETFPRHSYPRITVSDPSATGYVYGGNFGGLPVSGLSPHADPYHTGVPNLLTYAFFGFQDPALARISDLPQGIHSNGSLGYEFTVARQNIIFGAEWSATLDGDWLDLPDTGSDPEDFRFSVPTEGENKFLRPKVTES